ncbi:MAG: glycoside hydrolase family 97 protein [Flavobacteriia bacterium]|nr:MAG: glycoside hydrolase family 97 protein [Flavobacteriia bacterium]
MKNILIVIIWFTGIYSLTAKDYKLTSPDGRIQATVKVDNNLEIVVNQNDAPLFYIRNINMLLEDGRILGKEMRIRKTGVKSYNNIIIPAIKEKVSKITDHYNELKIDLKGGYSLLVRAYNNGVAYRFVTRFNSDITVITENMEFQTLPDDTFYFQKSETFNSSYETPYEIKKIDEISEKSYLGFPFLVIRKNKPRIMITEVDLEDYPGMWLKKINNNTLSSAHAGYPLELIESDDAYRHGQVKKHADYIAKTKGSRTFPWRLFAIAKTDAELLTNNLVYQLAKPLAIKDVSWIKPGVVAFDWWGRNSIYGVDFKGGVNTKTAKYFIDFAHKYGFKYFLFDDGWTDQGDLSRVNKDLDMKEVISYAKSKDIKIMLWAIWSAFEKDWQGNFDRFEKWGIAGIKFDFMNRDDQEMVRFYHRAAQEAAKRKMVLNFHGAYKPTGLRRSYPNVITREALIEFEYNGWTSEANPVHHNLLPYLRMFTGPMDYIPYATRNASKKDFRPVGDKPMGQGTRAHSIALSVILESPMRMLPDSPSDYYREKECTDFYAKIPVEWDEIKVLKSKIGKYTILARRHQNEWFIAAITDWDARDFELSLDFLGKGNYKMEFIKDGPNADITAFDYKIETQEVSNSSKIKIHLAKGGGWLARISKD